MLVVGFSGSLSRNSNTRKGVNAVLETCTKEGAKTILFDLNQNPLPLYHPDFESELINENVNKFRSLLSQADAIVLGSPEYHNSVSGSFKNALDWSSEKHFKNKPVALVAAAGGPTAMTTLNTMQSIVRSLHGWVIPTFGSIAGDTKFSPLGTFEDRRMWERFDQIGHEVVRLAKLLQSKKGLFHIES